MCESRLERLFNRIPFYVKVAYLILVAIVCFMFIEHFHTSTLYAYDFLGLDYELRNESTIDLNNCISYYI